MRCVVIIVSVQHRDLFRNLGVGDGESSVGEAVEITVKDALLLGHIVEV